MSTINFLRIAVLLAFFFIVAAALDAIVEFLIAKRRSTPRLMHVLQKVAATAWIFGIGLTLYVGLALLVLKLFPKTPGEPP